MFYTDVGKIITCKLIYLDLAVPEYYRPSILNYLAAVLLADEKELVLKVMTQQSLETLHLLLVAVFDMMV